MTRRPCSVLLARLAMLAAAGAAPAAANPAESPATDGAVFAGVTGASTSNVTTNPAALLRLAPGVHLFSATTVAVDQVAIDRRTVDPDTGAQAPGPSVRDTEVGLGLQLGVTLVTNRTVFALATALRPPDETSRDPAVAYHTRGSRVRRIDALSVSVAFAALRRLYIGLSATVADRFQTVTFARDTALAAGRDPARGVGSDCGGAVCGLENPAATEYWSFATPATSVSSVLSVDNLMYSVALMAPLPGGLWLGASYERPWRSGELRYDGEVTIVAAPRDGGATLTGDAVLIQHLPEVIRLGGRGPLGRAWELTAEARLRRLARTDPTELRVFGGDLVGTDLPERLVRPRGFGDALAIELGVDQVDQGERGRRWRLGARVGYDSGPVTDARLSARAPWGRQLMGAVGGQVRIRRWTLQLGYRLDVQLPASASPGAFDPTAQLACAASAGDFDLPACATVRDGFGTSTAAGDYRRTSHTARLAIGYLLP